MLARSSRIAVGALVPTVALALTIAACGGSDDDGKSEASASSAEPTQVAAERERVAKVMPYLRARYNAADGKGFCATLTAAGKKEVEGYASRVPELKTRDCAKFIKLFATKVVIESKAPQRPVRVKTVKIDGDTAKVTMKGGLAGIRSTATYTLSKEGGEWKVEDPISGAQTRRLDG